MKIANIALAILFFLFACFQYNDVDPDIYNNPSSIDAALWLLFYALIGLAYLWLNHRKLPKAYLILAILACLIQMGLSCPGLWQNLFGEQPFNMNQTSMSSEDPRVELTREFFGALIALFAVLHPLVQNRKKSA